MVEASSRTEQSEDPSRYVLPPPTPHCWKCGVANPSGTAVLGRHNGHDGARIAVCAPGEGCQDGRVFHGPLAPSHQPGEDCRICGASTPSGRPRRSSNDWLPRLAPQRKRGRRRPA
jgi:hypothetical protein